MDTNFRINLFNNWKIQSSKEIEYMGAELSTVLNSTNEWFSAIVPSTVLATLVANKVYTDPYFGKNMENIPTEQFKVPWWFCTEFDLSEEQADKTVHLHFDGINYKANVWLNGALIANPEQINGAFRRTNFNISEQVIPGKNILAIEVIPPKPGDFSIGFVDWNIAPPDNNMGIFRDVSLHFSNGISIDKPFVETKLDLTTLNSAEFKVSTELINHSNKTISGLLKCSFGTTYIEKFVSISKKSTLAENFSAKEFPELKIIEPKLWWPNTMGEPVLHDLNLSFEIDNIISDSKNLSFGIREVEDYINNDGHRGFKINGKEVLIKGAGWTDDLLLQDTHESLENQIAYVKHMNLNCIRLEGFWGKDHKLYDLCDQNGILMMVGWSCHWEHEQYLGKPIDPQYGGVIETDEIELIAQSWEDQIIWLRQHPAIFVWTVGSDMVPHPELEKKYIESFNKYDTSRPYLNSTGGVGSEQGIITDTEIISEISGSSCVKMLGPYAYTPPVYWFTNENLGGAYGFNTETCPGATVPPLASIKKMIPTESLWPIDEVWEYHCGSYVFGTLDRYKEAINKRYGEPSNIEDFAFKSQVLNYELMRPMFEAFVAHKPKSTGVIQWMLNSAWPEMYWQLYDSYLQPNGAFYAVRNACKTIHAIYRYGKSDIFLANEDINGVSGLKVKIRIYDINSQEIFTNEWSGDINGNTSKPIIEFSEIINLTDVWFLDIRVYNNQDLEIDNNFYWLSEKEDVLDYEAGKKLEWGYHTPSKQFADYTALNKLPKVELIYDYKFEKDNQYGKINLTIKNRSNTISFFMFFDVLDAESKEVILPIFWNDNYVSLLPGEERKYNAYFKLSDASNAKPKLKIKAWNVEQIIIE